MSIMDKIRNSGSKTNKKDWSVADIRLAVGLSLLGAKHPLIAELVKHPKASVTYLFNTKLTQPLLDEKGEQMTEPYTNKKGEDAIKKLRRPVTDDELCKACGVEAESEIIEFAENFVAEKDAKRTEESEEVVPDDETETEEVEEDTTEDENEEVA